MLSNGTGNDLSAADVAAVVGNNGGGFGLNGGEGSLFYLLILFLFAGGFRGNGFGGFGGNGGADTMMFPWMMSNNTDTLVQAGFNNQATNSALAGLQSSVTNGFSDTQLGLAGVNQNICQGFANAETAATARQMASMQQNFDNTLAVVNGFNGISQQLSNNQSNFSNCCCDMKAQNNANYADLKYTVATEACADRAAVNDAVRDSIANNTANTQAILNALNSGIQSIKDDMCADRLAAANRTIDDLRAQLNTSQMERFITAQTGVLTADNAAQTQAVENYIRPQVNPAYIVPNPYCNCNCNN